ncbi:hypothetical protein SAMN05444365_101705 [Micromonospora pattaloongensis]|uniref:Uncharacterized protein n=1 Tax=Micromonospora pattaloongensis TaxID=405436 RepID=A0A1H3H767_9ACTN|nr:hypothetical protein [Micromonospora pattaloongensis]SDY11180.1 hypothetical protein SAMN05444365_101705 [Micromonospora pattaloongensis]
MAGPGSPDGPPDGLPELPPHWGPIVIPDDPAELAAEALALRRELRENATRTGGPSRRPDAGATAPTRLRMPLLIVAIAMLTTLTSLFGIGWSSPPPPAHGPATGGSRAGQPLPALDVIDANGTTVPLRALLPAVIMLPERCECADQILATAAAVPAEVNVVVLTSGAAQPSPAPRAPALATPIRALADPASGLRGHLRLTPTPATATVLLVGAAGDIVLLLPATTSMTEYAGHLPSLAR